MTTERFVRLDIPDPPEGYTEVFFGQCKIGDMRLSCANQWHEVRTPALAYGLIARKPAPPFNPMDHVSKDKPTAFRTRDGEKAWVLKRASTYPLIGFVDGQPWCWYPTGYLNAGDEDGLDLVALWEDGPEDLDGPVTPEWVEATFEPTECKVISIYRDYWFGPYLNLCFHSGGPIRLYDKDGVRPEGDRQVMSRAYLLEMLKDYKK